MAALEAEHRRQQMIAKGGCTQIRPAIGEVLILGTDCASDLYAVGLVTTNGQEAFIESR